MTLTKTHEITAPNGHEAEDNLNFTLPCWLALHHARKQSQKPVGVGFDRWVEKNEAGYSFQQDNLCRFRLDHMSSIFDDG